MTSFGLASSNTGYVAVFGLLALYAMVGALGYASAVTAVGVAMATLAERLGHL